VLLPLPDVLTAEQLAQVRQVLDQTDWIDGRATAGHQSARVKDNMQLPEDSPAARQLGEMVLAALGQNPLFITAALPLKVFPPLFNRYQGGQSFGTHLDNAIRQITGTPHRIRTDLSATLFLTGPDEYDGGELVVEDTYGTHSVKLPAGHMILYPASSLHHVRPITRGTRIASFFWIQSMVRDDAERALLFDLDMAIQRVNRESARENVSENERAKAEHAPAVQLTGVYHNLLRRWADA
jgi:PKHD-type hydroxylase